MSDKFTLEEIEAVFEQLSHDFISFDALKKHLTKPHVEYANGEVIHTGGNGNWSYVRYEPNKMDLQNRERKLTTQEAGAGGLVEALEIAIAACCHGKHKTDLQQRLDKWKGERDE